MNAIEATPEAYADFVRLCRGKQYANTQEMLKAYHEWVKDVYGARALVIDGRSYPPGTEAVKPFSGSILWSGSTPNQVRYLKRYGRTDFILSIAYGFEGIADGMDDDEKEMALKIIEEKKEQAA